MFSWFSARKRQRREALVVWRRIVTAARAPDLFNEWQVADSFDGRFDSVALHAFLVMRRLKELGVEGEALGQVLFDLMFKDFDQVLREQGIGDMGVGKRVKKMAQAFLGRVSAYEAALASDDMDQLRDAIKRNLYREGAVTDEILARVADYLKEGSAALSMRSLDDIADGRFEFGSVVNMQASDGAAS